MTIAFLTLRPHLLRAEIQLDRTVHPKLYLIWMIQKTLKLYLIKIDLYHIMKSINKSSVEILHVNNVTLMKVICLNI